MANTLDYMAKQCKWCKLSLKKRGNLCNLHRTDNHSRRWNRTRDGTR